MQKLTGDILTVLSGVICHQANCRGAMGAGLALAIRKKYPRAYTDYMREHHAGHLRLGKVIRTTISPTLTIASICGQQEYRGEGTLTNYPALRRGLEIVSSWGISPIFIPYKMGCGLAKGNWNVVLEILEDTVPNAFIIKLG